MEHVPLLSLLKMSGSHMVSSPRISQRFVTYVPTSNSHAAGNFRTPPRVKPVVRGRFFRRTTLTAKRAKALAPCDWTISSMDFSGSGTGLLACNICLVYIHMYILPLGYSPTRTKKKSIDICVLRPAIAERKNRAF